MTDDLERRLRAADPTRSPNYQPASPSWISHLVEDTVNDNASPKKRNRWQLPAVAAAVLVLGIGGYAIAQHNDGSSSTPVASGPPVHLKAVAAKPGGPIIGPNLCVRTTPGTLKTKPIAFSGTVTSLTKTQAVLDVDHWYRGGDSDQVVVSLPKANVILVEGAVHWTLHTRYLVSATGGVVDGCGFTMPWTAHFAAMYAKAFG